MLVDGSHCYLPGLFRLLKASLFEGVILLTFLSFYLDHKFLFVAATCNRLDISTLQISRFGQFLCSSISIGNHMISSAIWNK